MVELGPNPASQDTGQSEMLALFIIYQMGPFLGNGYSDCTFIRVHYIALDGPNSCAS